MPSLHNAVFLSSALSQGLLLTGMLFVYGTASSLDPAFQSRGSKSQPMQSDRRCFAHTSKLADPDTRAV